MPRSILPLAEATVPRCGGKATMLRRLIEAGTLPVPPGVCLPCELYREALGELPGPRAPVSSSPSWNPELAAACEQALAGWSPGPRLREELERAAAELGWPLCCRSSASCEDLGLEVATAGVFVSRAPVVDLDALHEAIRAVWRSLWQPPAWAVLGAAGRWPGGEAMGVVLQPFLHARASGLLLSRDLGGESRMRLELTPGPAGPLAEGERDPRVLLLPREGALCRDPLGPPASELCEADLLRLRDAAFALEAVLLADPGPSLALELEWLLSERGLFLVQARSTRVVAPPRTFPICFHRQGDERTLWRWDREHNPEPLSPMHASLVELLDEHSPGPPRHLVLSGYLYQAIREEPEAGAGPDLEAAWGELREELESSLARAETLAGSPDRLLEVEGALAFFAELQARYAGSLAGARRAALRRLHGFLLGHGLELEEERERLLALGEAHATLSLTEEVAALAAELRGDRELLAELQLPGADPLRVSSGPFLARLRELLRRFGCLPHTWDVASATLAEEPARLVPRLLALAGSAAEPRAAHRAVLCEADALARSLASRLDADDAAELGRRIAEARLARALAEEDDLYFARALSVLRRTLCACGEELCSRGWLARPSDLFLLDLRELLEILRSGHPRRDLRAEAARRAAAWEGSRELVPPLTILGDRLSWPAPASGAPLLRGHGVGGVARGLVRRVERLEELLERPSRGEVLVCSTLLPALAIALPEAAALVTDHGGLLSHAASLARELGVPAVVGTGRATAELREGDRVWVDGSRGIVVRL